MPYDSLETVASAVPSSTHIRVRNVAEKSFCLHVVCFCIFIFFQELECSTSTPMTFGAVAAMVQAAPPQLSTISLDWSSLALAYPEK